MTEPALTRSDPVGPSRGVILMLHGGQQHSEQVVDVRSASWLRSRVMQAAIAGRAREQGLSTWLLRYRRRGWNAGGEGAVSDARWAMAEVRRELGGVPVVLLGHSMGARVSLHAADEPHVVGVVALAPWFPPGEPVTPLLGRHLVAAHGRRDRITSYRATELFVERARGVTLSARLEDMGARGHYMVRDASAWNDVAARECLSLLPD